MILGPFKHHSAKNCNMAFSAGLRQAIWAGDRDYAWFAEIK